MATVLHRIETLLAATPHRRIEHPPVFTSQEAADVRRLSITLGGKSLVMKVGSDGFGVFVVSAARRSDGRAIRKRLRVPRLRFASRDELKDLTGLEPGCVPPFGAPIFELPLYVDQSIADNDRIAFSAGDHTVSIVMSVSAYLDLARPVEIFPFSRP